MSDFLHDAVDGHLVHNMRTSFEAYISNIYAPSMVVFSKVRYILFNGKKRPVKTTYCQITESLLKLFSFFSPKGLTVYA